MYICFWQSSCGLKFVGNKHVKKKKSLFPYTLSNEDKCAYNLKYAESLKRDAAGRSADLTWSLRRSVSSWYSASCFFHCSALLLASCRASTSLALLSCRVNSSASRLISHMDLWGHLQRRRLRHQFPSGQRSVAVASLLTGRDHQPEIAAQSGEADEESELWWNKEKPRRPPAAAAAAFVLNWNTLRSLHFYGVSSSFVWRCSLPLRPGHQHGGSPS